MIFLFSLPPGFIDLGLGSRWRVMHVEWFEKAKRLGILRKDSYGNWIPYIGEMVYNEQKKQYRMQDATGWKAYSDFEKEYKAFTKEESHG